MTNLSFEILISNIEQMAKNEDEKSYYVATMQFREYARSNQLQN